MPKASHASEHVAMALTITALVITVAIIIWIELPSRRRGKGGWKGLRAGPLPDTPPIYVLDLHPENPETRKAVERRLNAAGVPYIIFPPTKRLDKALEQMVQDARPIRARNQGLHTKALQTTDLRESLTHQLIYESMVRYGTPVAMVVNDTTALVPDFGKRLAYIMKHDLPAEWDVINLHSGEANMPCGVPDSSSYTVMTGPGNAGDAYLVSNRGAQSLLKANNPVWLSVSESMSPSHAESVGVPDLKSFHIHPSLAYSITPGQEQEREQPQPTC